MVVARELGGSGVSTADERVADVLANCHQGLDAMLFRFQADGTFQALYVIDGLESLPARGTYLLDGNQVTIAITQPAPTTGCTALPLDLISTVIRGEVTWLSNDSIVINDGTALNTLQRYTRPRHRSITGQVVSASTGRPIGGATVTAAEGTRARTDTDGRFRLGGLPWGQATAMQVAAPGYVTQWVQVDLSQSDFTVSLKAPQNQSVPPPPNFNTLR